MLAGATLLLPLLLTAAATPRVSLVCWSLLDTDESNEVLVQFSILCSTAICCCFGRLFFG
jgi:hypothetical protein